MYAAIWLILSMRMKTCLLEMCDTEKYDTPTSKEMAALEFMIGE